MGKNFTKKLLPLALTAAMIVPSMPAMAAPSDIAGHWAESVITQWQSKGLIQGMRMAPLSRATPSPARNLSR